MVDSVDGDDGHLAPVNWMVCIKCSFAGFEDIESKSVANLFVLNAGYIPYLVEPRAEDGAAPHEKAKKEDTGISARCLPEGRKCALGANLQSYLSYPIQI